MQQLAAATDAVARAGILDQLATRVINPYIIMAVILVALGLLLRFAHLPEVDTDAEEPSVGETNVNKTSIWHFPHMILGAVALFFYVGVEVIAGDTIIRYGQSLSIDMSSAKYLHLPDHAGHDHRIHLRYNIYTQSPLAGQRTAGYQPFSG
ncbi:MAG: hypothetical protein MZV63_08715 [Marinilabiliales bacterium]|nr:hypothetical protein [Marinilabiliales bacterium]